VTSLHDRFKSTELLNDSGDLKKIQLCVKFNNLQ